MGFTNISNEDLIVETDFAVAKEKKATMVVLRHFCEIQRRRVFAERGFSSMFEMATKHFGYSEGGANRRVSAMWLMFDAPELETKIESGELSLTVAARVRSFCKKNKRDIREIASKVIGKSSREAERELLKIVPDAIPEEKLRAVTDEHTVATLVFDKELKAQLDRLLALRSHANPTCSYVELIRQLADLGEKHWSKSQRKTRSARMSQTTPEETQKPSQCEEPGTVQAKALSNAATRRQVFRKANNQCTYIDPLTGKRCDEKHFLEIDHIIPKAIGGTDEVENLRVLCRAHNQLAAIQKLGKKVMNQYLRL